MIQPEYYQPTFSAGLRWTPTRAEKLSVFNRSSTACALAQAVPHMSMQMPLRQAVETGFRSISAWQPELQRPRIERVGPVW
jgi:hypothetical protein